MSDEARAAPEQTVEPLREALQRIRAIAYNDLDECRYCGNDIEEEHPEDCPAAIALSALVREAAAVAAPPLIDDLARALEMRDVQKGGSPHITPGNQFYREEAAAILANIPFRAVTAPPLASDDLAAFFHEEYWSAANEPHYSREEADSTDCEVCWRSADRLIARLSQPSPDEPREP